MGLGGERHSARSEEDRSRRRARAALPSFDGYRYPGFRQDARAVARSHSALRHADSSRRCWSVFVRCAGASARLRVRSGCAEGLSCNQDNFGTSLFSFIFDLDSFLIFVGTCPLYSMHHPQYARCPSTLRIPRVGLAVLGLPYRPQDWLHLCGASESPW